MERWRLRFENDDYGSWGRAAQPNVVVELATSQRRIAIVMNYLSDWCPRMCAPHPFSFLSQASRHLPSFMYMNSPQLPPLSLADFAAIAGAAPNARARAVTSAINFAVIAYPIGHARERADAKNKRTRTAEVSRTLSNLAHRGMKITVRQLNTRRSMRASATRYVLTGYLDALGAGFAPLGWDQPCWRFGFNA